MKKSNLYQREPEGEKILTQQSRVEKFNAKMAKKENDTKAIIESQMKKEVATSSHLSETEGAKELMEAGAIHEAAVVFSHAGMGAFAKMFGNSMESAVENVLKERMDNIMESMTNKVSSVVEAKMVEMLEGMTAGMNSFTADASKHSINLSEIVTKEYLEKNVVEKEDIPEPKWEPPTIEEIGKATPSPLLEEIPASVRAEMYRTTVNPEFKAFADAVKKSKEESMKSGKPVVTAVQKPNPGVIAMQKAREAQDAIPDLQYSELVFDATVIDLKSLPRSTGRFGVSKPDIATMKPYIMGILKLNANKNLKSTDILKVLRNEYNIVMNNATLVMQKLMKQEPAIEKIAFGSYRYEEKTFRPTI